MPRVLASAIVEDVLLDICTVPLELEDKTRIITDVDAVLQANCGLAAARKAAKRLLKATASTSDEPIIISEPTRVH